MLIFGRWVTENSFRSYYRKMMGVEQAWKQEQTSDAHHLMSAMIPAGWDITVTSMNYSEATPNFVNQANVVIKDGNLSQLKPKLVNGAYIISKQ
jgi:hypothetical protein